ncbi:MAG: amidase [Sphingopyxis sp.]|uniref:amidase n=1 Tax=Sphingopyxis sp. TaxID=1908224 RepID=UPI003D6C7BA7
MTLSPVHRSIFLTGPFPGDGMRVAIKDCIDVAGETTTAGSRALATRPPAARDAAIVGRLRTAGCTIAGRVTMHELAYGVTGVNGWTGTPINPAYPHLVPGGSSSGSAAAVAAGLVDAAIGTDTGGSIRVPAACCGVVGFKPTFGRVSRDGLTPASSSLDCAGPFARSVADIERIMAMLLSDWRAAPPHPAPRIAFVADAGDEAVLTITRAVAESAFAITPITLPGMAAAQQAGLRIIARESWDAFAPLLETGLIGRDVHDRLLAASRISDAELAEAEAVRGSFAAEVDRLLADFDAIALPTLPAAPPSLLAATDPAAALPMTANCRPFNLSGHPAIALPVGEAGGAPVSLQLVGRKGGDEALCALARTIPLFKKGETA